MKSLDTVGELIDALSKFPREMLVGFLCPDGYEDGFGEISIEEDPRGVRKPSVVVTGSTQVYNRKLREQGKAWGDDVD